MKTYTYLALGDSYTIGEQVALTGSFPYQSVQALRKQGLQFAAPEIIAKTGWTSDELLTAMDQIRFLDTYDFVTVLIGVNNQYRGLPLSSFKNEFNKILRRALTLAGGDPKRLIVVSIPDWSVTPYAEGRDIEKIAGEIQSYNDICAAGAKKLGTLFLDITSSQRADGNKNEYLTLDTLHPSEKEYAKWAEQLQEYMVAEIAS